MPKKYFLFSLLVVVAIVVTIGWRLTPRKQPQAVSTPLPQELVVSLNNDGFDPTTIKIKVGTSVRWINNTSPSDASINSDNFPDNRLFPELNLGKFEANQSLSHIFLSPGTYSYHDQFHPDRKGTIEVE